MKFMKVFVYEKYGSPDVLHLAKLENPMPNDDEVLIQIRAVSINGSDKEGLLGKPLYARADGLLKPHHQILGSDIAAKWCLSIKMLLNSNHEMKCLENSLDTMVVLRRMPVLMEIP